MNASPPTPAAPDPTFPGPAPAPQAGGGRLHDELAGADQRTWAVFNHLVGMLALMDGMGLFSFIGTVVMWRIKTKDSPFLDDHGRAATNFQLSAFLLTLAGSAVCGLLFIVGIGVVLLPLFLIFMAVIRVVGGIRGAMAANRGEYYRYPMCLEIF